VPEMCVESETANLWAAYCLWFAYYNFCLIHRSLRVTPAMEAGITDHVWEIAELLDSSPGSGSPATPYYPPA